MAQWKVTKEESGSKLVAFLRSKLGSDFSARALKRAIESNACQINGRIERFASAAVGSGDVVIYTESVQPAKSSSLKPVEPIVLYSDEDLLIIDKPARVPSEGLLKLELVHRLDRDTSGVLLFAKNSNARRAMVELFRAKKVKKRYLAIVDGLPVARQGHIAKYIGKVCSYEGQNLWGITEEEKGLFAETYWEFVSGGKNCAQLVCHPLTGRTHQLRVHLSHMGHPILGDRQYGKRFLCNYRPPRCLLHAQRVEFPHPTHHQLIVVEAPLPSDYLAAKQELKL